jgi:hypothetical protein
MWLLKPFGLDCCHSQLAGLYLIYALTEWRQVIINITDLHIPLRTRNLSQQKLNARSLLAWVVVRLRPDQHIKVSASSCLRYRYVGRPTGNMGATHATTIIAPRGALLRKQLPRHPRPIEGLAPVLTLAPQRALLHPRVYRSTRPRVSHFPVPTQAARWK